MQKVPVLSSLRYGGIRKQFPFVLELGRVAVRCHAKFIYKIEKARIPRSTPSQTAASSLMRCIYFSLIESRLDCCRHAM